MMKRIILLAGILFFLCHIQAQEVSRGQLMDLFHKAQKATQAGNTQEALEIYKTILSVDVNLSTPYLKMADIYAADEGNEASMAAAAALYRKYLSLQPDDEDAAAITQKIAGLQQKTSNEADLNQLLYIGKEDVQNVFATKARPWLKARNKEELAQQIDSISTLTSQAQTEIDAGNTQSGIQKLEQVAEHVDPSNPVYVQTNMQLAEAYIQQGDVQKMKETLASVDENMNINKNLSQYLNTAINDATPFGDDICGIWVSDLAYNEATPYLVVEIQKDNASPQNYKAKILPFCTLAGKYGMYTGKPFNYVAKYSTISHTYFSESSVDSVYSDNSDRAYFYFGDTKFRAGMSQETTNILTTAVGNATESLANIYDPSSVTGQLIGLTGLAIEGIISLFSSSKTTDISLTLNIQRLFTGCAEINLEYNTYVKKTDMQGYEKESSDFTQMRLYKLYPEDKILFAANGNELFGYKTFTKDEYQKTDEFAQLQALKNRSYFNKQAYKKLSDKITDYCFAKAKENPEFESYANDCGMRFEYATKGLSNRTFNNKYGTFEGWVDLSGKMNGLGKCTLKDGTTYIGSWDNNKYSGDGMLTLRDKKTHAVTEYTGTFKNNKYNGKGLLQWGAVSYDGEFVNGAFEGAGALTDANGSKYDGVWKNNNPMKGVITYANGDRYDGECLYDKTTQQMERNGQGAMAYANGKTASGKWKNNELVKK